MTDKPAGLSLLAAAALVGCLLVVAATLWPGAAGGQSRKVTVLGQTRDEPRPACPRSPCEAVGSVTGFQARAGSVAKPFVAPFKGKIV
ncbi:MAG: hypothetical protein ACRDKV_08190, partial [Solirubrobacterales bacterium]